MSNNWRDIVENLKYYCAYCGHEVFQEQRQDISCPNCGALLLNTKAGESTCSLMYAGNAVRDGNVKSNGA